MQDQERLKNRWSFVKSKIISIWGNISEDELDRTRGNISTISTLVYKRHGDSKQQIASKLVNVLHAAESECEDNESTL